MGMGELLDKGSYTLAVVGLGYVGLPLAVEFWKRDHSSLKAN